MKQIVTLVAAILSLVSPLLASNYSSDVLSITQNLVGYWRMTDAAGCTMLADASAVPHNATIAGTVTCGSTSLVVGSADTSALFNGSTGTGTLGASGETFFHNWDRTQPFTIEALVVPNFTRTNGVFEGRAIFSKESTSSPFPGWEFGIYFNDAVSNKAVLGLQLINNNGTGNWIRAEGSTDLTNGVTWHVVATYDGTGVAAGLKLYVNGVLETNTNGGSGLTGSIVTNIVPQIGSRNGTQFFFKGNIQELAVYNGASVTTRSLIASNVISAGKPYYHYGLSINRLPLTAYSKPNVILDTDLAGDIDDVVDLATALYLHRIGAINLIGIITSSANARSADTAYALATASLGIAQSFIGAWQGAVPTTNGSANSLYTADISATFGANVSRTSYADSTVKYRSLVNAYSNIIIVSTGFSTALDDFMNSSANSGGDGLPSGQALISANVNRLVLTSGCYPASSTNCTSGNPEYNFVNGPSATANDLIANWPVEVIAVGIELGNTVYSGPQNTNTSSTNPLQQAWHDWGSTPRQSWGALGVLFAAYGINSGLEPAGLRGSQTVNSSTGANTWAWTSGLTTWTRKSAGNGAFSSFFNLMNSSYPSYPAGVLLGK